jgi:parvulin-like peptidyl-prolyl isomerase
VSWQDLCQDLGKKSLGKTREEISLQEVFTEEEDAEQRVDFGVLQAFLMAVC